MNKLIFFQCKNKYGVCDIRDWKQQSEKHNLLPIRYLLAQCSDQYADELIYALDNDQKHFIEMVKRELDEDSFTTYTS